MTGNWAAIFLLAATTVLLRSSGPLIVGRRDLPPWTMPVIAVLPAALLTALIVVQVFTDGDRVMIDERMAGLLAAAAVLTWRRRALLPAMFAAAAVVALIRAISW